MWLEQAYLADDLLDSDHKYVSADIPLANANTQKLILDTLHAGSCMTQQTSTSTVP